MRGSPVLRTLIVAFVLLLTGLGLARLTRDNSSASAPADPGNTKPAQLPVPGARSAAYEIILSAEAAEVTLEAGGEPVSAQSTADLLSGNLEIPGENPLISLRIKWADNSPGHRFAKLRLEIPGQETLEHVFSAPGDIDDLWEP
jgi:hypothetical protein